MLRGILTGGLSGLVVGGVALTGLSLAVDQPAGNTPPAVPQVSAPSEAAPAEISSTVPDTVADDSTGDAVAAAVPQVQIPEVSLSAPVADTTSAALPQAGAADALPDAPEVGATPTIAAETVEPVLPNPQSIAPQVPVAEEDIAVSTEPAAPPAPPVEQANDESSPVVEDTPEPVDDPAVEEPISQEVVTKAPEEVTAPEAVTPPLVVEETATEPDPEPAAPETVVEIAPVAPVIVTDPTPELVAPEPAPEAPSVVSIVPDEAPSLPGGTTGVAIRRPGTQDDTAETENTEKAIDPDAPAIVKFAGAFENPEDKPLLSVVLIDDGSLDDAVGAVAAIGAPVTVVLDPDLPNAALKLAAYRKAGVEVAVRAVLPDGATPADVETAFEASFSKLPETALLMDDGAGGLQNNRATTEFAMEALARDGRGFVTISKGLNTALRLAEQNEVPAGVIYRDLDADGQDARVIRRFLDQAAFRARQDGSVILMGRVRPDTVSALILWGTANRAGQVVFAPVSATLLAN